MNIGSKSQLTKLLATEDISVEHANVETAYFDLKARKVVLPNWKDIPPELYDLLLDRSRDRSRSCYPARGLA